MKNIKNKNEIQIATATTTVILVSVQLDSGGGGVLADYVCGIATVHQKLQRTQRYRQRHSKVTF